MTVSLCLFCDSCSVERQDKWYTSYMVVSRIKGASYYAVSFNLILPNFVDSFLFLLSYFFLILSTSSFLNIKDQLSYHINKYKIKLSQPHKIKYKLKCLCTLHFFEKTNLQEKILNECLWTIIYVTIFYFCKIRRRSVGTIMFENSKCYTGSRRRGMSYIQ
jgi:hypothetical protein